MFGLINISREMPGVTKIGRCIMMQTALGAQKILLLGVICFSLNACAPRVGSDRWFRETPPEQIRMHFAYNCQSYGFRAGSSEFAECIQKEINDQKQRNTISNAATASATGAVYGTGGKSGMTLVLRETFN